MSLTIGADPEFFLFDTKKDMHISAHDLVPGTKAKPYKLKHGAVQLDGTAVEFNIDPAKSSKEFTHNINEVLKEIRGMIPKRFSFSFTPSVFFDKIYFEDVPESSKELGCDPDYLAYYTTPTQNTPPKPSGKYLNMRTGAGHIHIGWTDNKDPFDTVHYWDCVQIINSLYYPYYYFRTIFDKDKNRTSLYGNGPVFRPKKYGCEFRSPSNAWLNYPKIWPWLFDFTVESISKLKEGKSVGSYFYYSAYLNLNPLKQLNNQANYLKMPVFPSDWNKETSKW